MQKNFVLTSRIALLAGVALAPLSPAVAATHTMPTPGLYRVDTVTDQQYQGGTVKTAPLANNRGVVVDTKAAGMAADRRILKGNPAPPLCIAANTPLPGFTPPRGTCTGAPAVTGPNGITFSLACGFMDMTTVVRKLDDKTWEYNLTTVEYEGGGGAFGMPDSATQKKMFEATVKHGATPEERADAAKTLSNWPAYEAEMRESIAEMAKEQAEAAKQAGTPVASSRKMLRKTSAVLRYTKIAAKCTPAAGAGSAAR